MITLRPSLIISLPMRLTLFTAITWLLGGCVASVHSTKIDTSKPLDPNNGVVAVQVVNNAERLSGLNSNWTSVIVIRLDTIEERKEEAREKLLSAGKSVPSDEELEWNPDYYPLSSQFSGTKDSRIFLGMMPEGEYMISRLFSVERIGNMTSTVSMPVGYTTGKFMVEKARFTDLGTLLFHPLLNIKDESFWSSGTSFRAYVTRTSGSLELDQLVQLVHPKLKSSVDFESPLTWQKDGIDEFRQKVAKISQDNLYGSEFTALDHHAKGVLPTRLGRVRVLNSNSEWTPLELPTQ